MLNRGDQMPGLESASRVHHRHQTPGLPSHPFSASRCHAEVDLDAGPVRAVVRMDSHRIMQVNEQVVVSTNRHRTFVLLKLGSVTEGVPQEDIGGHSGWPRGHRCFR